MLNSKHLRRHTQVRLLLPAVAVIALAVAGCGSAVAKHNLAGGARSPQEAAAVWRSWASCARSHGAATMPDPRIRADGTPDFGDYHFHFDTLPAAVTTGCGHILDPLPGEATVGRPLSNADFHKLLQFSACMRQHGIPNWPDPNPEGVFTLSPQIRAGGKGLIEAPLRACELYNTNPQGGINAVEGP